METVAIVKLLTCIVLVMISQGQMSGCQECDDYLVTGPRGIQDSQISASSFYTNGFDHFDPKYGRLYLFLHYADYGFQAASWSSMYNNDQQYIQATFSSVKIVKAILTQGRSSSIYEQWVTSYYVSYSKDGITWSNVLKPDKTTMVRNPGNEEADRAAKEFMNDIVFDTKIPFADLETCMIFPGNTDKTTVVNNTLPERVEAKYIRIRPKTWHGHVSLKFDIIGCTALAALRNQMYWTRHPVDLSPIVYGNLTKSIQSFSRNEIYCGAQCLKNEQCVMFSFNKKAGTCTGFPSQVYQREKSAISSLEKDQYFISFPNINVYEYEIVESKMFGYKIITWSTTAESALARCQKEGARLLTVHDLDQLEYVQNKIKDNLILSQQTKYYVNGSKKDGKWKYSTGVDVPSGLWAPSEPVASFDCVTLTLTGLQTHDCKDNLYFVCGV